MQVEQMQEKDAYKTSRVLYIVEAALEYFISLLVSGAFLANVTSSIGISDSLTGILTSFVSLGCGFQLIAIFLANKRPVKRWVTLLHSCNQAFFAFVYLVPFVPLSKTAKVVIFIVFLLLGHAINNVVNAPKINWYMNLVDDKKRGRFTANKEMVSLIGGMIFSFIIGSVSDYFKEVGNLNGAFIFSGVGIFVLMISHTLVLLFSKEKPIENEREVKVSTGKMLSELVKDKNLFKVIFVTVLWNIANYVSLPFYGTYQIKELGFTMTFVSLLSALYAICRTLFSSPMGKFADKYSFAKMLSVCFVIKAFAFLINIFTVPANGKIFYTTYYMLTAVAMAGINSATINLIYDYVDKEKRMCALALNGTCGGFAGFFTTLAVSPLVSFIQNNGNQIFGVQVYAQQVVSAISFVLVLGVIFYLNFVVAKLKNKRAVSVNDAKTQVERD